MPAAGARIGRSERRCSSVNTAQELADTVPARLVHCSSLSRHAAHDDRPNGPAEQRPEPVRSSDAKRPSPLAAPRRAVPPPPANGCSFVLARRVSLPSRSISPASPEPLSSLFLSCWLSLFSLSACVLYLHFVHLCRVLRVQAVRTVSGAHLLPTPHCSPASSKRPDLFDQPPCAACF